MSVDQQFWHQFSTEPAIRLKIFEFKTIKLSKEYEDRAFKCKNYDNIIYQGRQCGKYRADIFSEKFNIPIYNHDGTVLLKRGKDDSYKIGDFNTMNVFRVMKSIVTSPFKQIAKRISKKSDQAEKKLEYDKLHEENLAELREVLEIEEDPEKKNLIYDESLML